MDNRYSGIAASGLRSLFAKKDNLREEAPADKRSRLNGEDALPFSPFPLPTLANSTGARIGFITFIFEEDFDILVSEDWESGRQKHFFHKGKDLAKESREFSLNFAKRTENEKPEKPGEKRAREEDPWAWMMGKYKLLYQADFDLGTMVRFDPFGYLVFRNCQVIDTNLQLEEVVFPLQHRKNIIDFHKVVFEKHLADKLDPEQLKIVGRRWVVTADSNLESFVEEKWNQWKKEKPDMNTQEVCDSIVKQWEQFKEKESTDPPTT